MAPSDWKPVSQPGLAEQIKNAPQLELTDVAPAPERCWVGRRPYLVPNPDGKSWDMVYPYYNKYGGVQEVVIHDFGSGRDTQASAQHPHGRLGAYAGADRLSHAAVLLHRRQAGLRDVSGRSMFVVYDPAVDAFVARDQAVRR